MLDSLDIRFLLRQHSLRPKKELGQNFLVDDIYLLRIIEAAEVSEDDEVLEIGAGVGSLTRYLCLHAGRVTAVELDADLIPILSDVLESYDNLKIVEGDIMQLKPEYLVIAPGYKIVANIPYYLTSNLIRRLLEADLKPTRLALTVQKEVAERICAEAGEMSLLSLSVQVYGDAHIALEIPAGAFFPIPDVDSALLVVELLPEPRISPDNLDAFFQLSKSAFAQKRKMLHNSLAAAPGIDKDGAQLLLDEAGIDGRRRPQTLALAEWETLSRLYSPLRP